MKSGRGLTSYRLTYILCLALFSGSIASHTEVFAQAITPNAKNRFSTNDTLKEVQIKGIKPSLRHTSITPVQTLAGQQLENLNSLSVADALRFFSGVQIKDYGGIGGLKTVNIRSLGSQHTAVFYDGIQLGNAQDGEIDLGRFSLDNIEEIDLYNSQRSSIFQPARAFAAASSIYLQSKIPVFKNNDRDHVRAAFKTGSFGLFSPSLAWQHKISNKISSTFSTEWQRTDGRYKFRYTNSVYDTTAVRQNGDTEALRLEGGLHGSFADSSEWSVKIFQYFSERGLPRAIVRNNFESRDRQWDRNTFVQASWTSRSNGPFQLMLNAKYAHDYMRYLQPGYDNIEGSMDNRYRQKEFYASAAGRYSLNSLLDIALSTDLLVNDMSSNMAHFSYPARYTSLTALASEFHSGRFRMQGSLLGTLINETTEQNAAAGNKEKLSPAFTASWQPFPQNTLLLRAFYKDIFRMPTFNDLYYTFSGNTALRPENTKQYDAGFTILKHLSSRFWQSISLQADAYYNHVKDKIVAVPGENIATWMMMNLGEVNIKGAEVNMTTSAKAGKTSLNATLAYTYQQALDVTSASDFNYRHQIPYTPEHSGSFILNATRENISLNYSYIYTGERYSQKANIPDNYMEPWYTHDISASGGFKTKKIVYKATAEVNNLFNQYRDVILNFPMPGRSYRFTLSMNY
ncbi:outer membrane cobalamin receptor [Arcticibacter tournemirensis]|uniref:TonB-dependent receptor n=1 Tax=Arcticibacter tournemirensis TaxID=699437 RepID=A0A5M9HMT3_9SPHI|nr:TonB-dependent receptor plug domain-containing protein [Arcticibacter tournemirensis]KAA8486327.1 TonB-dependent receptor [Arcticibacter tournemirensis]TQM52142.1 outer membrane cobalamin receptor [Arcticibacter tournemirensis]